MKLITKPALLQDSFLNLLSEYKQYYWATAWASPSSEPFKILKKHAKRIKQITVGLHFYQTHPDFIEQFQTHPGVRFIKQPSGTFHPKLFLFYNSDDDWALLTGSANFTQEAFSRNTEACVLIDSADPGGPAVLRQAFAFIEAQFEDGAPFDPAELDNYRAMWKKQRSKIQSLSGQYGASGNKAPKPAFHVDVMTMSWPVFMKRVRAEGRQNLEERLQVIQLATSLFRKTGAFKDLSPEERKFIAGLPNKLPQGYDWGFFGSMKGFGDFRKVIGQNNAFLSQALDEIPLTGELSEQHYERYIDVFLKAFEGASKTVRNPIASATRLLAMKRPDTFVCFDSKNRDALCKDFGIKPAEVTIHSYWNLIVRRIKDSEWWQSPEPSNSQEQSVYAARAAFLDALYYEPF